jgi:hypothetical protein
MAILQDGEVSGRAREELHSLVDTVSADWDADEKVHHLELRGKLLEIINAARPADEAGLAESVSSLNLVAGARFQKYLPLYSTLNSSTTSN